ncbi:hypothetical protein NDU88_002875 [Pleurodeles waltl]|uniref:Uncharacterized protein n=1 Tax=Pleurodeles waltl TaxID=8319 RepID=A0AAV7WRF3_PLEWA|nr:hypothetical protein NDU88_002875 [Pleurodeles waltl]
MDTSNTHKDDDMDDDEFEGAVHVIHTRQQGDRKGYCIPKCIFTVEGHPTSALFNTSASVNIMAQLSLQTLPHQPALQPMATEVHTFGSPTPLPLAGIFTTTITHDDNTTKARIYVTQEWSGMLMSCMTTKLLQLVSFTFSAHQSAIDTLMEDYAQLFKEIG